jgi:hypothetical protein
MSTWESQELPVLRAIADHFARSHAKPMSVRSIAIATGLPTKVVKDVLRVLAEGRPPYIEGSQLIKAGGRTPRVTALTERALHELDHIAVKEELERGSGDNGHFHRRGPFPPGGQA